MHDPAADGARDAAARQSPDRRKNGGCREAAIVAWAQLGSGDWAGLTARAAWWQQDGLMTGPARWS